MENHDLQMAKNSDPGTINLAVGEPYFLQYHLYNRSIFTEELGAGLRLAETAYPPFGGNPKLIDLIKTHLAPGYKHIIITNGARQGILAALYAAREVLEFKAVYHEAPYWPSYPMLAKQIGLEFNSKTTPHASAMCITTPNNPDGSQTFDSTSMYYLWDAAYAHSVYGYRGNVPRHNVAVFSCAKTLGLSGLRIGFVATNDDELAKSMTYYVEIATSGVSIASQLILIRLLEAQHGYSHETDRLYNSARQCLLNNAESFEKLIAPFCTKVSDLRSGMFAWFQPADLERFNMATVESKIKLVTGVACGGAPEQFRMSLGIKASEFHQAMLVLNCNYNK
jgi:aspartate/methionine/tyrosine aminotransferase